MALPKVFAVGEILTAQDTNEHLNNRVGYTYYDEPTQIVLSPDFNMTDGFALLETHYEGPFNRVTLRLRFTNVPRTQGGQNLYLATIIPALRPLNATPIVGYAAGNLFNISIQPAGTIALRWSPDSSSAGAININGSYLCQQ